MKILTGKVVSKKMNKTATVAVERIVAHRLYKKRYKRTKKYHVHDELGSTVGQQVKFVASKPYSRLKKWKLIELIDSSSLGQKQKSRQKVASKKTQKIGKKAVKK